MRTLRNLLTTLVLFVLLLAVTAAILIVLFAIALAAMLASSIVLRTMTKITEAVLGPITAYILAFLMIGMWVAWAVWVTFVCSRLFLRALFGAISLPGFDLQECGLGALSLWYAPQLRSIAASPWRSQVLDLVAAVASDAESPRFHRILLIPGAGISTIYLSGERSLVLGALVLRHLSAVELRAAVAHECAHHFNGAMLIQSVLYRTRCLSQAAADATPLISDNWMMLALPGIGRMVVSLIFKTLRAAAVLLGSWARLSRRMFAVEGKSVELRCDRVAARAVGAAPLCSALSALTCLSTVWKEYSDAPDTGLRIRPEDAVTSRLLTSLAVRFEVLLEGEDLAGARSRLIHHDSKTHPSVGSRMLAVGILAPPPRDPDGILGHDELLGLWELCTARSRMAFANSVADAHFVDRVDVFGGASFVEGHAGEIRASG